MIFQRTLLALFITSTLAACGSSSSDNSTTPDSEAAVSTKTLSGKVADGYLQNATVCLDLNKNKECDADEPSAVSTEGGVFSLEGVTQEQIDLFPLLVKIIKGQTIDEDNPGVVLTKDYTLSAPAGYSFVSPLTTMVQSEIEKGSTEEEAKTTVQGKLGTTLNISNDYIAGKTSSDSTAEEKEEFEKLHKIAQVTATVIANNIEKLESTASESDISVDQLVSLIISEVFSSLAAITSTVASSDNFDASTLATDIDALHIAITTGALVEKIAKNDAEKNALAIQLVNIIKVEGINWFWSEDQSNNDIALDYGTIKLNDDGSFEDIEYQLNVGKTAFELSDETFDAEGLYVLSAEGWESRNDTLSNISINVNNSVTLETVSTILNETITGKALNISGMKVNSILQETAGDGSWSHAIAEDIVFPEGSIAYDLSFTQNAVIYGFSAGSWCNDDRKNALDGMCNGVTYKPKGENSEPWAVTMDELIIDVAYDMSSNWSEFHGTGVSWFDGGAIYAELVAGGTVNYYNILWTGGVQEKIASSTWTEITVNNEKLIKITAPQSITKAGSQFNPEDGTFYLTEMNGHVRVSWAESNDERSEYVFDSATKEFILGNIDLSLLPIPTPQ